MRVGSRGRVVERALCGECGARFDRGRPAGGLDCPLCGARVAAGGIVAVRSRRARSDALAGTGHERTTDGTTLRRVLLACGVLAALAFALHLARADPSAVARVASSVREHFERESEAPR